MPATTEEEPQNTSVEERNRLIRRKVLSKVETNRPTKVDIKAIGPNRFRVNVWAETGVTSEVGFFTEQRIVETFVHQE